MSTSGYSARDIFLGCKNCSFPCSADTSALQAVVLEQEGNQIAKDTVDGLWSQVQGWEERWEPSYNILAIR